MFVCLEMYTFVLACVLPEFACAYVCSPVIACVCLCLLVFACVCSCLFVFASVCD